MRKTDLNNLLALSFAAGAASATLLWWIVFRRQNIYDDVRKKWLAKKDEFRSGGNRTTGLQRTSTPPTLDETTCCRSPVKPQDKTGLCIGSIFGMDVGGSLTKLVYFEQRTTNKQMHPTVTSKNEKQEAILYHRRASSADMWVFPDKSTSASTTESLAEDEEEFWQGSFLPDLNGDVDKDRPSLAKNRYENSLPTIPHERKEFKKKSKKLSQGRHPLFNLKNQSPGQREALNHFYRYARGFSRFQSGVRDSHLTFYSKDFGGDFHFIQFETRQMSSAMNLIRSNKLHSNIRAMGATGGGAHKYAPEWERVLGIKILKEDELDALVVGMQFVLSTVIGESYTFRPMTTKSKSNNTTDRCTKNMTKSENDPDSKSSHDDDENVQSKVDEWSWTRKVKRDSISPSETYPYLLVTIGTGVSILRVDGPGEHVRVSGSTIGGGTYYGLIRLLTDAEDFESVLGLAEKGDSSMADMMVGDIYGKDSKALEKIGLPSNLVASSFGKLVAKTDPAEGLNQEDVARALLLMVTNNIGQVAYLNAQLHKTPRIYFVGNFLRQNSISQHRLSYAINYWSKGEMEALFLEHEGYLGALGSFLKSQGI
mmetsp:Transcript_26256/g.39749  ORF Transcript_26256/g.39749 Transcript_26256/m.39749 type:complete len:595 (-) Transcript_26256:156-1940(-)